MDVGQLQDIRLNALREGPQRIDTARSITLCRRFGNPVEWMLQAMERALQSVEGHRLDVVQVCYRTIPSQLMQAIQQFDEAHP